MRHWERLKIDDFLACHPKIRIKEIGDLKAEFAGEYHLKVRLGGEKIIDKFYQLRIIWPREYPSKLPRVIEEGCYFPRSEDYHTYSDGSLCLGSELRVKLIIGADMSLAAFFENVVEPFLYSVTHRIEFGYFPFGELDHGEQGLIDDYEDIFGIEGKRSVLLALEALGKRKRVANKIRCPCGCGSRLGRCDYRYMLNNFRNLDQRRWFRAHVRECFTPVARKKKSKVRPIDAEL